jgi:hypothetical protein
LHGNLVMNSILVTIVLFWSLGAHAVINGLPPDPKLPFLRSIVLLRTQGFLQTPEVVRPDSPNLSKRRFLGMCTGIVVEHGFMLTAAHCVEEAEKMTLYPSSVLLSDGKKKMYKIETLAKGFIVHAQHQVPLFINKKEYPDLVIVTYPTNKNFEKHIEPLGLEKIIDLNQLPFRAEGYQISFLGHGCEALSQSSFSLNFKQGRNRVFKIDELTLYFSAPNESLICDGDSGGPIFVMNPEDQSYLGLIGVNSANVQNVSYGANAAMFADWVKEQIAKVKAGDESHLYGFSPFRTSYDKQSEAWLANYYENTLKEALQTLLPVNCSLEYLNAGVTDLGFQVMVGIKLANHRVYNGGDFVLKDTNIFLTKTNSLDIITLQRDLDQFKIVLNPQSKKIILIERSGLSLDGKTSTLWHCGEQFSN